MTTDIKGWLQSQVETFKAERSKYDTLAGILQPLLQHAVKSMGISAIVRARTKEIPSFAEKCMRKRARHVDPVHQFTDLCGARVIVESKDQIKAVCDYLQEHFDVHEAEDTVERLRAQEFAYQSFHLIVSLKEGITYPGVGIPTELFARRTAEEAKRTGLSVGPIYKAEVQVRTILQHAWAAIIHDNLYKSDFQVPRELEREAGRISALLEDADDSFVHLLDQVHSYRSCHGAYMSPKMIKEEIELLEAVFPHDANNPKLAHQIARLAMCIDDWKMAINVLRKVEPPLEAPLQRDLGLALLKHGDSAGLAFLETAAKNDPDDADALCELGDACLKTQKGEALHCYTAAFEKHPTYPRALRSFIQCRIMQDRSPGFLALLRPAMEEAIRTCRQRARVGVHLPWAYYDMGFFSILLGRSYEGLAAFAKAVQLSATESAVQETCRLIEDIQKELTQCPKDLERSLEWVRRFLLVATVGKLMTLEETTREEVEHLRLAAEMSGQAYEEFKRNPDEEGQSTNKAMEKADEAERQWQEAGVRLDEIARRVREAPALYLAGADSHSGGKRNLVSKLENGESCLYDQDLPAVIVAGGCDAGVAQKILEYQALIESAFEGFEGTVVSGGTTAGISGIIGNIPNQANKIVKIAYLPEFLPRGDVQHDAYRVRQIEDIGYTPLGPLQAWIDLLASGIRPSAVRLIGINGGELSAFEYRLGLVMGAKVGILRDSGREATRISDDPEWKSSPDLLLLPTDDETVKLFLQPTPPSTAIEPADREVLAGKAHEEHRKNRSSSLLPKDPALADWDKLPPHIKTSNYQQVDHIEAKLARIGLELRKVQGREIKLFAFAPEEIEELAEMEHARWNVERLLDGWTLGERDPENKISPYLIPWKDLTPDVRKWDRDTVTALPRRLKELGYEIFRSHS